MGLTTIPSRVQHMGPVIKALANQTRIPDAVCVSVPKFSNKEQIDYPLESIKQILSDNAGAIGRLIITDKDYGPLTKLMGILLDEKARDEKEPRKFLERKTASTLLITADDDQLYGPTFVETLTEGAEEQRMAYGGIPVAVCLCGHNLGSAPFVWGFRCSRKDDNILSRSIFLKPGTRVTVVSGWCGCAYPVDAFVGITARLGDQHQIPEGAHNFPISQKEVPDGFMEWLRTKEIPLLHRHDDLYISCWLYRLQVPKVVIAYRGPHLDKELPYAQQGALSSADSSRFVILLRFIAELYKRRINLVSRRTFKSMVKHLNEWWRFATLLRSRGLLEPTDEVSWNRSTVFVASSATIVTVLLVAGMSFLLVKKMTSKSKTSPT